MSKFESIFEDFKNAAMRFEEVLREPKTEFIRDSSIKRFEITFELAWKTIKAFLEEEHNITCVSPKNCLREAYKVGIVDYDEIWIDMVEKRNLTAHIYKEIVADKIYKELPGYLSLFQKLLSALESQPKG